MLRRHECPQSDQVRVGEGVLHMLKGRAVFSLICGSWWNALWAGLKAGQSLALPVACVRNLNFVGAKITRKLVAFND